MDAIREKINNFPGFPQDQYAASARLGVWSLKMPPWPSGRLGSPLILPLLISESQNQSRHISADCCSPDSGRPAASTEKQAIVSRAFP